MERIMCQLVITKREFLFISVFLCLFVQNVYALIEFDQNVTSQVIFGSGNSNGNFTTDRRNGIELGLRAKIPFSGLIHSNGNGTYSYTLTETDHDSNVGTDRRWNFEYSVNTNYDGSSANNLDQYTYEIGLDADPSEGTNFLVFDPITANTPPLNQGFFDHSIGTNATANGAGVEAIDAPSYSALLANNNLLQQSWRYAFFPISPLDTYNPDVPGLYDIYMKVILNGVEVAKTTITIIIFDPNDHLVTPDVIFGSGNSNGNFTISKTSTVEVGLRAKIPFTGLTHYDGDHTYSYSLLETDFDNNPGTANRWNFEFSVNTDYLDPASTGLNISDFTYEMGLDADPGIGTNYLVADPITPIGTNGNTQSPDHSFGNNMTVNGAGTEPLFPINLFYIPLYEGDHNVVQSSSSLSFLTAIPPLDTYDPSIPGTYDIYLLVKLAGVEVARVAICVLIEGGALNSAPTVMADTYSINEDMPLNVVNPNGVLSNDSDIDGDSLQVIDIGVINAVGGIGGSITMSSDGTFTYTPPVDFNGTATFNYGVFDGSLTTPSSLTITVNAVNDIPSFAKGANEMIMEDTGIQTINSWATGLSPGPANESMQNFSFNVSNDNNSLFSSQPAINANGDLSYATATNANGVATVTVSISDDGGIANGGIDTSAAQTFSINIVAVNDAPEFAILGDQIFYSLTNNLVQVPGFAHSVILEPLGELGQSIIAYTVNIDVDSQNILISATIDNNGMLDLNFDTSKFGTAILSVTLQDNAGTANMGVDTSITHHFNVSHLLDDMFKDGFEDVVVAKMSQYVVSNLESVIFTDSNSRLLPAYNVNEDRVSFINYDLDLHDAKTNKDRVVLLKQWIDAVLLLEYIDD
jgi:hypothetical protein